MATTTTMVATLTCVSNPMPRSGRLSYYCQLDGDKATGRPNYCFNVTTAPDAAPLERGQHITLAFTVTDTTHQWPSHANHVWLTCLTVGVTAAFWIDRKHLEEISHG